MVFQWKKFSLECRLYRARPAAVNPSRALFPASGCFVRPISHGCASYTSSGRSRTTFRQSSRRRLRGAGARSRHSAECHQRWRWKTYTLCRSGGTPLVVIKP
jgi:hypothetical protein